MTTTLEELLALDAEHRRAHEKAYAAEAPVQSVGVFTRTFTQELRDWFRGRFGGVIGGIGADMREGVALPERDALTRRPSLPEVLYRGNERGGGWRALGAAQAGESGQVRGDGRAAGRSTEW